MEDIFLAAASPPELDMDLFLNWVNGITEEESLHLKLDLCKRSGCHIGLEFTRIIESIALDQTDMMKYEIIDQYRIFELLEHFLSQPLLLKSQCVIVVKSDYQPYLVDNYWSLDDKFVCEVLHKKLAKSRKDLEDASDSTGLNLKTVTRQFENIKRILNAFEDSSSTAGSNIYSFIIRNFLLCPALARKYASIVFLLQSRFNLTSKRRLLTVDSEKYAIMYSYAIFS